MNFLWLIQNTFPEWPYFLLIYNFERKQNRCWQAENWWQSFSSFSSPFFPGWKSWRQPGWWAMVLGGGDRKTENLDPWPRAWHTATLTQKLACKLNLNVIILVKEVNLQLENFKITLKSSHFDLDKKRWSLNCESSF